MASVDFIESKEYKIKIAKKKLRQQLEKPKEVQILLKISYLLL